MSRLLSWFSSKSGRTFSRYCVGAAALTVFSAKSAIHGPFLNKLKEICQLYKDGEPKAFSPEVKEMIEKVLHHSNLKEDQKKKINFFYVVGVEPFHAGGIGSPLGAIIGFPFFFDNMKECDISYLRLKGRETTDWIIDGRDLLDSLILTDRAKKFAILREIYSCNILDPLTNAVIAAGCILLPAYFTQRTNISSKAFERFTVRLRCVRYSLFYTLGYLLYLLLKDPLKHLTNQNADRLAAETGSEYLDGGIEYYEQTILKNKALDDLSATRFWRTYDEKGNENYVFFSPKLPITKRLENLQDMKAKTKQE